MKIRMLKGRVIEMSALENFYNLNISEECHKELAILISEKLVDVVNRAMRKGALPPFKKGTKLTSYNVKNKKKDTIADGDKSAVLFVKAEGVKASDNKTSDKQLNRELNNTPRDAYLPLASKINRKKYYAKDDLDLNGDKKVIERAIEKSKERNKKK
jgi:hypothetical protein